MAVLGTRCSRLWALVLLFLINAVCKWDNYLLPYLSGVSSGACTTVCKNIKQLYCEPCGNNTRCTECHTCQQAHDVAFLNMQDATCINGVQFGILTGFAFSLTQLGATLLVGPLLVDRFNRRNLLGISLILWSISSGTQALGNSYQDILLSRLALAVTESVSGPASYVLVAAFFPPQELAMANGIRSCGLYIGVGLASLSIVCAKGFGWRATVGAIAGLGIVLAGIFLGTVKNPVVGGRVGPAKSVHTEESELLLLSSPTPAPVVVDTAKLSPWHSLKIICSNPAVLCLYAASCFRMVGGNAIGSFIAKYFQAAFPAHNSQFSVLNALVVGIGGSLSSITGGILADYCTQKYGRHARAYVPIAGTLLAIPFISSALFATSFYASIGFLAGVFVFGECWIGPATAMIQEELPLNTLGMGYSIDAFTTALITGVTLPLLGMFYDAASNKASIRWPILVTASGAYGLTGYCDKCRHVWGKALLTMRASSPLYRIWALVLLFLINVTSKWDNYLLPYLSGVSVEACSTLCDDVQQLYCEPCGADAHCLDCHSCLLANNDPFMNMQDATCINGVEYGILTGFAFSLTQLSATVLVGPLLVDRFNRRNILGFSLILWSISSGTQALGHSYRDILLSRMALALTESISGPASYVLVATFFPPSELSVANGVHSCGLYIGVGLASLSILFARGFGWRATVGAIAGLGIVLAALFLTTVRNPKVPAILHSAYASLGSGNSAEPDNGDVSTGPNERSPVLSPARSAHVEQTPVTVHIAQKRSPLQSLRIVLSNRAVVYIFLAGCFRMVGGNAMGSFIAKYYQAAFPDHNSQFSVLNALVVGICGSTSAIGGGALTDRLALRYGKHARTWVPIVGSVAAMPCVACVLLSPSFYPSIAALVFAYLFAECWMGPAIAIVQSELPLNTLGMAYSLDALTTAVVTGVTLPILGNYYDDAINKADIRWPVLLTTLLSYFLTALFFWLALRNMKGIPGQTGSSDSDTSTAAVPSKESSLVADEFKGGVSLEVEQTDSDKKRLLDADA